VFGVMYNMKCKTMCMKEDDKEWRLLLHIKQDSKKKMYTNGGNGKKTYNSIIMHVRDNIYTKKNNIYPYMHEVLRWKRN
jgi:hypothetical protein